MLTQNVAVYTKRGGISGNELESDLRRFDRFQIKLEAKCTWNFERAKREGNTLRSVWRIKQ